MQMRPSNLLRAVALAAFTAALVFYSFAADTAVAQEEKDFFTVIVLPDTQYYSERHPAIFKAQTEWIKANVEKENILFVLHLGDITNNNVQAEWDNADAAMSLLDGVVPYSLAVGNHDTGHWSDTRDLKLYNENFPASRYEQYDWYGGHMEGGNQNHYCFFEFGDFKFMTIALEFGPTDETLEWANGVVAAHPDCMVIVTTHCYMNCDDTRVGNEDRGRPQNYPIKGNDGQMIWDKFVSKHSNIFLVLSGHIVCRESAGKLIDTRADGSRVIQILANYQDRANGGNGWLRILRFYPGQDVFNVTAYSPFLDRYNDGIEHTFVVWRYVMKQ